MATMRRGRLWVAVVVVSFPVGVACSSSSSPTLGSEEDSGADSMSVSDSTAGGDGSGSSSGGDGSPGAEASAEASMDGGPADASTRDSGMVGDTGVMMVGDSGFVADTGAPPGDAAPPTNAVCQASYVWTPEDGIDPAIPSAGFGQFGAVSQSELTVAWTTSSGAIQVADRASKTVDFGAPSTVTAGATALATDRVALDVTGTLILAVSADRTKLVEITRQSIGSAWGVGSQADLVNVNALSGNGGGAFSEPVLGDDGKTLYVLFALPAQAPALQQSIWDPHNADWALTTEPNNPQLASTDATHRRRPTGGSSDALTLFYYDEIAGTEMGAWRDTPSAPFTYFGVVGAFPEAAPNYLCDRLYFQGIDPEGGGQGLGNAY